MEIPYRNRWQIVRVGRGKLLLVSGLQQTSEILSATKQPRRLPSIVAISRYRGNPQGDETPPALHFGSIDAAINNPALSTPAFRGTLLASRGVPGPVVKWFINFNDAPTGEANVAQMADSPRNVVVLGSTGSIGCSTLEVIGHAPNRLRAWGLSAHSSVELLASQARQYQPRFVAVTNECIAAGFAASPGLEVLRGSAALEQLASHAEVDVVVAAVVGSAGLRGAWAALESGKTLALANKETLVMAGPLVTRLAQQRGAKILPVDSEHSAVYQALACGRRAEVKRVVLTASGGPFRQHTKNQLRSVTVEQALAHPTWRMGKKITVDSATMMNKALEIIEARWLFDLAPEQIGVVIHPQSLVHSLVEFIDGSVIAQLSPPDMKLPIQFALSYPERWTSPAAKLDWQSAMRLEFEPPDEERFPALRLGHEVARSGGTAGAVLNAANEAAVARFLAGNLRYHEIVPACEAVLRHHAFDADPTLEQLVRLDRWARLEVNQWSV